MQIAEGTLADRKHQLISAKSPHVVCAMRREKLDFKKFVLRLRKQNYLIDKMITKCGVVLTD
jgi:hypothetical protein